MIALWLALAQAATVQSGHELEWDRAPASAFAPGSADGDPAVREATATALGRLHRADALPPLIALRADPDEAVLRAVADGLGWTPGSAPALRAWLDELGPPTGLAARAASEDGVRNRAIEALGRQGDRTDLERLTGLLAEPWPTSAAAAEALGRLGRRGIEGASDAIPALIDALGRPDPRTVEAAAYAIRRIGLEGADPEQVQRLAAAIPTLPRPMARAWVVGAVAPQLEGSQLADLYGVAITDQAAVVKVAALDAVRAEGIGVEVVSPYRLANDGWIRQAAVAALGRMGEVELLREFADGTEDPWEQAWAIAAAGAPLGRDWSDTTLDLRVRAAALEAAEVDPSQWIQVATDAEAPLPLRTAAASALLAVEVPDPAWADALLGSVDPAVREAGLELLSKREPGPQAAALVTHCRAERDLELLGTALAQLAALVREDSKRVAADDPHLASALRRAAHAPTARTRLAAQDVAAVVGLPLEIEPDRAGIRELILPTGEVVEVKAGAPVLAEVDRIRSARIRTTRGEFTVSLDPHTAPLAVANFARLAESGFYDGRVFHRIVPGFVAQTGCPRGDGWGGPGWTLPDEVSSEPYTTGSLGMARSAPWDTGGSQWFISTAPTPHLEGDYTRFGEVVQGMPVVRSLELGDQVLSVAIERLPRP